MCGRVAFAFGRLRLPTPPGVAVVQRIIHVRVQGVVGGIGERLCTSLRRHMGPAVRADGRWTAYHFQ